MIVLGQAAEMILDGYVFEDSGEFNGDFLDPSSSNFKNTPGYPVNSEEKQKEGK